VSSAIATVPEAGQSPSLLDLSNSGPVTIPMGDFTPATGRFATKIFRRALAMPAGGQVDKVWLTPLNKAAIRLATPGDDDEIAFTAKAIRFHGVAREFNVLKGLRDVRVASQKPLSEVASLLNKTVIFDNLQLIDQAPTWTLCAAAAVR